MSNVLDRTYAEVSARLGPYSDDDMDYPRPDVPVADPWNGLDDLISDDFLQPLDDAFPVQETGLDDDARRVVDGGIREIGMEALAFYKSFRFVGMSPFPGHWGIFYLDPGIKRVQELIKHFAPSQPDLRRTAIEFLRCHERLHFKFDVYALGLESALSKHLYEPLKRAFRPYPIHQVEEGLANHEAWRWASNSMRDPAIKSFAEDFMSTQPGGYSRFKEDRKVLTSELAANLIDLNLSRGARRDDQALWVANVPVAMSRWQSYCPEYEVSGAVLTRWINPAWKLPTIKAIQDGKAVIKALKRYADKRDQWEGTKEKLIQEPGASGLRFKHWDKATGVWSVRVDANFRAHLRPVDQSNGVWEANEFGPHTAMGHG
jgi:hypothetical protein